MATDSFGNQMVAAYQVAITGIDRTEREMAALDAAIKSLRAARYSSVSSATAAVSAGSKDIFVTKFNDKIGRVQTKVQHIMLEAMNQGKEIQAQTLRAATTPKGLSGRPAQRNGPGRDVTGDMIQAIQRNVEVYKANDATFITGYHGWGIDSGARGRVQSGPNAGKAKRYFEYQEKGTVGHHRLSKVRRQAVKDYLAGRVRNGGVPPANSLGTAIVPVREFLYRELKGVK